MMKKASLRIRGNVQMAGFRTYIKTVAESLNLNGFAENEEDGNVNVVCEGEGEAIGRLINSVKQNSPSFVRIEEVKAEFSGFERRGVDVPGEGESEMVALMRSFDKKGEVMIDILSSMNETVKGVKGDTNNLIFFTL
jgi:acylphosphatase